jgi:vancomycin permeability regulator SanA
MAEMYFRWPFYYHYLLISALVMLGLWAISMVLFKVTYAYPTPKGFYLRLIVAWTATTGLAWFINHFVLVRFMVNQGERPDWSIFALVFTWIVGLVLILISQAGLALLQRIFLSGQLKFLRKLTLGLLGLSAVGLVAVLLINMVIKSRYDPAIYSLDNAPEAATAIVFGAGVYPNSGRPSAVLRERLDVGADLLEAGKVQQVLLSGAGSGERNEVNVMVDYMAELGISEASLLEDQQGVRTLATCQRAAEDFGVEEALLVSQGFHLPRALFLCESFGIEAQGVQADQHDYSPLNLIIWNVRESIATTYAWFEVKLGL